jgi:hypothetical protein
MPAGMIVVAESEWEQEYGYSLGVASKICGGFFHAEEGDGGVAGIQDLGIALVIGA